MTKILPHFFLTRVPVVLCLAVVLGGVTTARAETPDEWIKLLTRVHGGFGSFLPVGIRIGEDAMKRLDAKPRELSVVFYQGEGTPCPCAADGVSLALYASAGQGTLLIAPEKSPPGTFASVVIRPRKGGEGLRYTVPMAMMPKLGEINATISDPRGRYDAVMAIPDLYTVEVVSRLGDGASSAHDAAPADRSVQPAGPGAHRAVGLG
jgi:hypothetical protein